ncbi:MAG TPA: hypothetical protein PLU26_07650 [Candidatus Competibacter sp.]|nr:hypothetical protein [Candidatus Competibacteraceae bacterium]HUM94338.1 hypothetical protein [Candidatus Competibacter sp.]
MDWMFLLVLGGIWLVSPVIFMIALIVSRSQIRMLRERLADRQESVGSVSPEPVAPVLRVGAEPSPYRESEPLFEASPGGRSRYAPVDLENLALLRLELQRLSDGGELDPQRHRQLVVEVDRLWERHLQASGAQADNELWRYRRVAAWRLLAQAAQNPPGPPPWQPAAVTPGPRAAPATAPARESEEATPVPPPPTPAWTVAPLAPPQPPPAGQPLGSGFGEAPAARPIPEPVGWAARTVVPAVAEADTADALEDWRPQPPGPLEKALQALSGWPRLIAPFLAQNIGWFVGGFCFIAGALFLIANTSGFINALVVFASLFGASAFLLWAGYQFRRKRPELTVASSMLLTLGMLLAPLVLAVAARTVAAARGDPLLSVASLGLAALSLGAFAWAANLVSALMDRVLQGRYARLLTALGAVQLAAPLAGFMPDWRVLVALHVLLLGLLGYGLWAFAGEWLRRLFVDRRLTAYYAAGMLVYAAVVSFVHLTWLWPEPLPAGYAGPFLMAVCGLLFPVDAAFKEWVNKYTFLSRFSFVLYGLSVAAVAIASQSTTPLLLALALGALLYGWMTWRYRTLPPLYLLFICLAGLYGFGLLQALPPAWRGLASQPGLLALLGCGHWAASRSRAIAVQCLSVFALLLIGSTVWSLSWTAPGWLGFMTAATAALLAYVAMRAALALPEADPRWVRAGYGIMVLAAAAVAYLPEGFGWGWGIQTAYGWLALAALWAVLGLRASPQTPEDRPVWVNGALANIALALGLAGVSLWPAPLGRPDLILLLISAGALLLWLSLALRRQPLFYGALACAAGAGMLVKHGYFPGPGTGGLEFVGAAAVWVGLWRLNWRLRVRNALSSISPDEPSGPEQTPVPASLTEVVHRPLEQVMALLWTVGLTQLTLRFLSEIVPAKWSVAAGLGVVTGFLLIGYFHRFRWVALPVALGLVGGLVALEQMGFTLPWLAAAAVLYALLVWRLGVALLAHPSMGRWATVLGFAVPGGAGGRRLVEESVLGFAMLVAVATVAARPMWALLGLSTLELLPALLLALLLLVLTAWHYRSERYAYVALVALTVAVWSLVGERTAPVWFGLGQPLANVLLSAGMALAWLGLEAEKAAPLAYWRTPLQWSSGLLFLLALAGALLAGLAGDARLPGLLALLCVALFPVARPWPNASAWRGLGLALLSSALAWSLAGWADFRWVTEVWIIVAWGYALWFDGNLLLPRWNVRQPAWAVAPEFWPLLGLACVLIGGSFGVLTGIFPLAAALAVLAPYLFLLLRNTAWPGMAWSAVGALVASGLLAGVPAAGWPIAADAREVATVLEDCATALVWLNGVLLLGPLWRRHGQALAQRLDWRQQGLAEPLYWLPFAAMLAVLARLWWLEFELFGLGSVSESAAWRLIAVAALLVATAGHGLWLRRQQVQAHGLLLALFALAGAVFIRLGLSSVWLPLAAALADGALVLAWRYGPRRSTVWRQALEFWLTALPAVILTLLFVVTGFDWRVIAATLLALAAVVLAQGWWQGEAARLKLGVLLALAGSYTVWLIGAVGVSTLSLIGLATPWYALQTVVVVLGLTAARPRLAAGLKALAGGADEGLAGRIFELEQALETLRPWLLASGLLWLGWHAYAVLGYQTGWGPPPWRFGATVDPWAAGMSLLLLAGWAGQRAWRQPQASGWIYASAVGLGLLAAYIRLVVLGATPFAMGDTAALMVAAYAVFLLHQFTAARPFYHLALVLPLLALATAPWQLASTWTGGTLLATAVLYLSLAGTLRNPLPFYLGVIALNGAVYLWAPLWANRYGLWQFYIVPAAVSVLALLQLHRRELRPSVLSAARLAALSALYAGAGLDVFLRPELWVFVLALALALAGVALGVALRVRAFLYAGVAFLVLNVLGQLVRFYPDQGLSRALILIGLGASITVGMVWFNLKREAIMQRIRIARADLAAWE